MYKHTGCKLDLSETPINLEDDSTYQNEVSPNPVKDGDISLFNSNCILTFQNIDSDSVDLILTDPPYNLGSFMKSRNAGVFRMRDNHFVTSGWDDLDHESWLEQMELFFQESFRVMKDKSSLIVFMSLIKVESLIKVAQKAGFYYKTTGIWHKTNPMPRNMKISFVNSTEGWIYFVKNGATGTFNNNGKMFHDFVETSLTPLSEKRHGKHPTQKPMKLMSHFIELLSNEGETILDPFMGSGTTAVCSKKLKRKFIGSEIDKDYFDLTIKRLDEVNT